MNISYYSRRIEIAFWTALVVAMRSPRFGRILVQVLSVSACALLLISVFAWAQLPPDDVAAKAVIPVESSTLPKVDSSVLMPTNGQNNLLLVLVDRLSADHPQLNGVWLVARISSLPHATFLPLYPSSAAESAFDDRLADSFTLGKEQPFADEFVDALKSQGLWWNHYLIIDAAGLAYLVDNTPGLYRNSSAILEAAGDAQTAIDHQAQIARAVCAHAFPGSGLTNAAEIVSVLENYAHTDLTAAQLRQAAHDFNTGRLTCQFPTLAGR